MTPTVLLDRPIRCGDWMVCNQITDRGRPLYMDRKLARLLSIQYLDHPDPCLNGAFRGVCEGAEQMQPNPGEYADDGLLADGALQGQ